MDNEGKGLLDALYDQIMERDAAKHKLEVAHRQVRVLSESLRAKIGGIQPSLPRSSWIDVFTTLLDDGDYVSASKLAIAALDYIEARTCPLKDAWQMRYEMARRLLDESKQTPKVYDPNGMAYKC